MRTIRLRSYANSSKGDDVDRWDGALSHDAIGDPNLGQNNLVQPMWR